MPCESCKRRDDKRYEDRDALCRHLSLQGMEKVQRLEMCPFTFKFLEKKKITVGQRKQSKPGKH